MRKKKCIPEIVLLFLLIASTTISLWFMLQSTNKIERLEDFCDLCLDGLTGQPVCKLNPSSTHSLIGGVSVEPINLRFLPCSGNDIPFLPPKKWHGIELLPILHIQKTGGTTLEIKISEYCCTNWTNNSNFCEKIIYYHQEEPCRQNPGVPTPVKYLYKCGYHPTLPKLYECMAEYQIIPKFLTIIRHPVNRVISEYFHLIDSEYDEWVISNGLWEYSKEYMKNFYNRFPTADLFVKDNLCMANNRQSLALLESAFNSSTENEHFWANWLDFYSIKAEDFNHMFNSDSHKFEKLLKYIVETQFIWVGNYDYFCESMVVFNYIFQIDLPDFRNEKLVSKTPPDFQLDHNLESTITKANKIDAFLYKYSAQRILWQYQYLLSEKLVQDLCKFM